MPKTSDAGCGGWLGCLRGCGWGHLPTAFSFSLSRFPGDGGQGDRRPGDLAALVEGARNALPALLAEVKEAREIIDKLPKTKDGVLVAIGRDRIYCIHLGNVQEWHPGGNRHEETEAIGQCYSTRAAAEAAKESK